MTGRSNRPRLLGALVLAAACALVWSGVASAQQSETPSELWQEYPLDPEPGAAQLENAPQAPSSRSGDETVGGGGGGSDPASATDEEPFPLIQVAVALGLLLLGALHGVSVLARRRGLPERLRERISDLSLPQRQRPVYAARGSHTGFLARSTEPRSEPAPPAADGGTPAEVAEEPAKPPEAKAPPAADGGTLAEVAEEPAKLPKPKAPPAADGGTPAEVAEEPAKLPEPKAPPAADGGTPAEVAEEPAKPPKPKAPPVAPRKPTAQKRPSAKPVQHAKPVPPAKPAQHAKPAPPAKHVPPVKPVPGAKPARAAKRPKPAPAAKSKAPTPKKPHAERPPSKEQPPPVAAAAPTEKTLTCSIFGWRDGPTADFYALATGLLGHEWVVERSPRFEWLGGDFPVEAYEAHAILVDGLLRAGWQPAGSEGAWYRQRFERPVPSRVAEGSEP